MPTLVERRKDTQQRALRKQRRRIHRRNRYQRIVSRLNHEIKHAATRIGIRRELIVDAGKPKVHLAESHTSGKDRIEGGSPRERLRVGANVAAERSASGERRSFYSQPGGWDVHHGITGEDPTIVGGTHRVRSDCSQFQTALYNACGLPDPNGTNYTGGYTGTLGAHGKAISSKALQPGDLGLYGPFPHHHVEMYVGNGRWIGHGSPPVDSVIPGYPDVFRSYV